MTNHPTSVGRMTGTTSEWVRWFVGTLLLIPICFILGSIPLYLLFSNQNVEPDYVLFTILLFVLIGGSSSAVQYHFLRRRGLNPRRWIGVSTSGAGLGAYIGFGLFASSRASTYLVAQLVAVGAMEGSRNLLYNVISAALIGGFIGAAQAILLWKQLRSAYWWLIMTVIVWELWAWMAYIQSCHAVAYRCL